MYLLYDAFTEKIKMNNIKLKIIKTLGIVAQPTVFIFCVDHMKIGRLPMPMRTIKEMITTARLHNT